MGESGTKTRNWCYVPALTHAHKASSKFKMSFNSLLIENLSDLVSFPSSNTQESLTQGH